MVKFIPTYLYIKQHTTTGKLYFGKTTKSKNKMLEYRGSGTHWRSHIKQHGIDKVTTLWYQLYDNIFDLVADSLSMSKSLDIVNSKSWLNIIDENGLDGSLSGEYHHMYGRTHTIDARIKISKSHKGRVGLRGKDSPFYGKTGSLCHNYGKVRSEETRQLLSKLNSGENHPRYGKTVPYQAKVNISIAKTKRYDFVYNSMIIMKNMSTMEFAMFMGRTYENVRVILKRDGKYKGWVRTESER